jgi:hypothetical protein
MEDYSKMTEEELKRSFLANGSNFFGWNSGKNTPNILLQLNDTVGRLNDNIKAASDSSSRLANALNRLTLAAVIVYGLTLLVAVMSLVVNMKK